MSDHSEINFWICNYLKCLARQSRQSHQSHQDKEGIDGDTMVTKVHAEGVPSRNQRRCAEWSADAESSAILICSGRCVCVSMCQSLFLTSQSSHCFLSVFSIFCLMFDVFFFSWKCICPERFVDLCCERRNGLLQCWPLACVELLQSRASKALCRKQWR